MVVSGSTEIRAGSEDPKTWQMLQPDKVTPYSLEGATKVVLRLKDQNTGAVKEFATDDDPVQLEILDPPSDGKVKLSPAAADFPSEATWIFHFWVTDGSGKEIPIPEDSDEALVVRDSYSPD